MDAGAPRLRVGPLVQPKVRAYARAPSRGLSALTALELEVKHVASHGWLGAPAPSLRELVMDGTPGAWLVEALRAAPPLAGLTKLVLVCG